MTFNSVTSIGTTVREDSSFVISVRALIPSFMNLRSTQDKQYFLSALFESIDEQVQGLLVTAEDASQQLFLSTASGQYLLNLGSSSGFTVPQNSGVDSSSFKEIVPAVVSSPLQIVNTMVDLMSLFYDKTRISPYMWNTAPAPYALSDGDSLQIETESGTVGVSFLASQVSDINNVSASDIVGIINSSQSLIQASVYVARDTNQSYVQIISNAYGTGAYIQVIGGTAQNTLKFPTIAPTQQTAGTTWILSKSQIWTDVVRFRWNGVGTPPALYSINIGDFVTIKDMVSPYNSFNGSFKILNVGSELISGINYDFFEISNFQYQNTSGTFVTPNANSMVFTLDKKIRIFDAPEYAVISELDPKSISVYVPAVPTVLRKDLFAASHLHGWQGPVVSLTRNSITIDTTKIDVQPVATNSIVLASDTMRFDATLPSYKTIASSGNGNVTYILSADPQYNILPWTVPTIISTDIGTNLYAEVFSDTIVAKFDYPHGLRPGWAFNISGATGSGNFTSALLNKEQLIERVIDQYTVSFRVKDPSSRGYVKFEGIPFNDFDLYQNSVFSLYQNSDFNQGYDFFLLFNSINDLTNSGLKVGSIFAIDLANSTAVTGEDYFLWTLSKFKMKVVSIVGTQCNVYAGLGSAPQQKLIASPAAGIASGGVGGANAEYYFNQASAHNAKQLKNLNAIFTEYTPSINAAYVGSYIFDPDGIKNTFTVGTPVTSLQQQIEEGSNVTNILVQSVEGFPADGYVVLEYGTNVQEGPIRYFSVVPGSQTVPSQVILDPSYVFKFPHSTLSQLQIVTSLSRFTPASDGSDYPVYLTGTTDARNFFFTLLESITAAGVFIDRQVQYPDIRYADPAINPYD